MAGKAEKTSFRQRWGQLWMAFTFTKKNDKWLIPILLAAFVVTAGLAVLLAWWTDMWFVFLPAGLLLSILMVIILFGRRVAKATYSEVEGKPGAAAAVLENIRGNWRLTPGVAATPQYDVVHRLIGRPGVILVIEGSTARLRNLVAQEKKRVARVAPETPIYEVAVGNEEGRTPLKKLQGHLVKLPRNITPKQINALENRLAALGARPPIPKGPLPKGARMPKLPKPPRR